MSFKSLVERLLSRSSAAAQDEASAWSEKRENNRIDVTSEEDRLTVHLSCPSVEEGKATTVETTVLNVSLRGCRLKLNRLEDRHLLKVGQVTVASLTIKEFSIPLQFEVVRIVGDDQVAVRFKPPFPRELERLDKFLEPRCLGLSMREIDPTALQGERQGVRWFQGVNETNLFCWMDGATGRITQQQLVFLERP